eukprot:TRINITY_DN3682_c0_g1_i12.p1 TRINITY_DN3682_c0_g1~~TRINITY_DN3682_c0_g1_i12.p1  ORF type:complete len:607 (+),score=55.91 TRINITY_DN3682_c0_g1_i12:76-1896(+)
MSDSSPPMEFYVELIEFMRTSFFDRPYLCLVANLKKDPEQKSSSSRCLIHLLDSRTDRLRAFLQRNLDRLKYLSVIVKGVKYMEDISVEFLFRIKPNAFQFTLLLAGRDNDMKVVEPIQLRLLLMRYFVKCNNGLRMGAFFMEQLSGKIGMKINFDMTNQIEMLDPRHNREGLESFLRTMMSTASHGWTFHMHRILYLINEIDIDTYLCIYSHISHRKVKLDNEMLENYNAMDHLIRNRGVNRKVEIKSNTTAQTPAVVTRVTITNVVSFENSLFPSELLQTACLFELSNIRANADQGDQREEYRNQINSWIEKKKSQWTNCNVTCLQVYFGGFAFVAIFEYKSTNEGNRVYRTLAVKMPLPNDPNPLRIQNEIDAILQFEKMRIVNPGFVRYYLVAWNGELFAKDRIFMDAHQGYTLDSIPRNFAFTSLTTILTMLTFLTHAIRELAINNCSHNDLKPTNIIISKAWIPKIIDFGEVSLGNPRKKPGFTIPYVPPENLRDNIKKDKHRSVDVFSFGVILYELLFGIYPFDYPKFPKGEAQKCLKEGKYSVKFPIHYARFYGPQDMMEELMLLCYRCIDDQPQIRPTVEEVCDIVQKCANQLDTHY